MSGLGFGARVATGATEGATEDFLQWRLKIIRLRYRFRVWGLGVSDLDSATAAAMRKRSFVDDTSSRLSCAEQRLERLLRTAGDYKTNVSLRYLAGLRAWVLGFRWGRH